MHALLKHAPHGQGGVPVAPARRTDNPAERGDASMALPPLRHAWRATTLAACCLLLPLPGWAERPFLATETAMAEDDDEEVWEVSTGVTGGSGLLALEAELEYAINPYNGIGLGLGYGRLKEGGETAYERELEIEYQHILVDIARSGFGLGLNLGAEFEREEGSLEHAATVLAVPLSWRNEDDSLRLHASPGWVKPSEGKGYATLGLGLEKEIDRRNVLIAEIAADNAEEKSTVLNAGWRHWIRPGKMAVDVTVARWKFESEGRTTLSVGLSLFDLK
jgi:hypothetical protein